MRKVGKLIIDEDESYVLIVDEGVFVWHGVDKQLNSELMIEALHRETANILRDLSPADGDPGVVILNKVADGLPYDVTVELGQPPRKPKGKIAW